MRCEGMLCWDVNNSQNTCGLSKEKNENKQGKNENMMCKKIKRA